VDENRQERAAHLDSQPTSATGLQLRCNPVAVLAVAKNRHSAARASRFSVHFEDVGNLVSTRLRSEAGREPPGEGRDSRFSSRGERESPQQTRARIGATFQS